MSPEFMELDKVVPTIHLEHPLLPRWLQDEIDSIWHGIGYNGTVYAAIVSETAQSIRLFPTTFAVLTRRGKTIKIEIKRFLRHMSLQALREAVKLLNETELDDTIILKAEIVGSYLYVKIHFQTVNITAVGICRGRRDKRQAVLGYDPRVGFSGFGGVLDFPDLFAHAEREIFEEAGFRAKNLRIVGMIRAEKSVILAGVCDAPAKWICRFRFPFRQDHDKEMESLVFVPEDKIRDVLYPGQKMWSPLPELLEKAMCES